MSAPIRVTPIDFRGWNMSIAQMFGSGPKFTVTCGQCSGTFTKRIPMMNNPGLACPYCNAINVLPLEVKRG